VLELEYVKDNTGEKDFYEFPRQQEIYWRLKDIAGEKDFYEFPRQQEGY